MNVLRERLILPVAFKLKQQTVHIGMLHPQLGLEVYVLRIAAIKVPRHMKITPGGLHIQRIHVEVVILRSPQPRLDLLQIYPVVNEVPHIHRKRHIRKGQVVQIVSLLVRIGLGRIRHCDPWCRSIEAKELIKIDIVGR